MDDKTLKKEVVTATDRINALVVNSADSYGEAGQAMLSMNDLIKKIKSYWKDPKSKAHESWKAIVAKETEMIKPVEERKKVLNNKISEYLTEQDRIKKEEQRKLDEKRIKEENAEREKLLKKAQKAEEKGNVGKADELRESAEEVYIPPALVTGEVDKTTRMDEGTASVVKDVEVDVIDTLALLTGILSGTIPESVITINVSKLKTFIKTMGIKALPGCTIREISKAKFRSN